MPSAFLILGEIADKCRNRPCSFVIRIRLSIPDSRLGPDSGSVPRPGVVSSTAGWSSSPLLIGSGSRRNQGGRAARGDAGRVRFARPSMDARAFAEPAGHAHPATARDRCRSELRRPTSDAHATTHDVERQRGTSDGDDEKGEVFAADHHDRIIGATSRDFKSRASVNAFNSAISKRRQLARAR